MRSKKFAESLHKHQFCKNRMRYENRQMIFLCQNGENYLYLKFIHANPSLIF